MGYTAYTTDSSGDYYDADASPGTICLQVRNIPSGWFISPQDRGSDDTVDSDANPANGRITNVLFYSDDLYEDVGLFEGHAVYVPVILAPN